MPRPAISDFPEYFGRYINQVNENELAIAFANQRPLLRPFFESIPEERSSFAYAPGKWSIKQLLQHMIDAERVFNYRALCIARGETAPLPSFDENAYAGNAGGDTRTWQGLTAEFLQVRASTEALYDSFTESMLSRKGTAGNNPINVLSLGFITVGHVYHHMQIVRDRYLD